MSTLLDTVGPAVWRASWQAAVLAILIALILRSLGARMLPRWRYLIWGVVVFRLLFVATPISPWSVFNLVRWNSGPNARPNAWQIVRDKADPQISPTPQRADLETRQTISRRGKEMQMPWDAGLAAESSAHAVAPSLRPGTAIEFMRSINGLSRIPRFARLLSLVWLVGCVLFGLQLLGAALVLHRRLSACRPVTDAAVLTLLAAVCRRIGLKRSPALLVTPASISPCIVGTWNPKIIVPESIVTEASTTRLRHVLAHETAHVVRGDLWTNWLLLTAQILHWFNPVAWWTIREMQAEREAACDELALAALGEADRSSYAATIIELAARLTPSAIAPAMIGLIPSARRLTTRVERLLRSPAVTTLRAPFAAGFLLGLALIGLTDAMPAATADQSPAGTTSQTLAGQASPILIPTSPVTASPAPASPVHASPIEASENGGTIVISTDSATKSARPNEAALAKQKGTSTAQSTAGQVAIADHIAEIVRPLLPSIVIVTRIDSTSGRPEPNPNWHSGFVVDGRGYILTMLPHYDGNRQQLRVRLANQSEYLAELVATDPKLFLAVLRIRTPRPIAAVPFSKARIPQEGDAVIAVPSPLQKSATTGVVTGVGQSPGEPLPQNLIRSDLPLPLGEGGCLMVSDKGEPVGIWVGIRTAKRRSSFAVPLNDVLPLLTRALPPPATESLP